MTEPRTKEARRVVYWRTLRHWMDVGCIHRLLSTSELLLKLFVRPSTYLRIKRPSLLDCRMVWRERNSCGRVGCGNGRRFGELAYLPESYV